MPVKLQKASFSKCTVTPPSLNRQHSYSTRQDAAAYSATTVLANVASRNSSPARRKKSTSSSMSANSTSGTHGGNSAPASPHSDVPPTQRRTSWEDCRRQRDGYISFPDYDQLHAEHDDKTT